MLSRVALIGDVHANLPALEAVLDHAHGQGAQSIWNIGDFIGYGAFPDEVVKLIRREDVVSIIGNYDLKVLEVKQNKEKWRGRKLPRKLLAFEWAYDNLSKKSRKYLRSLPREIRLNLEGWQVLLTHGSPASNEEPITRDTPEERLWALAKMAGTDVIVCGHSHQPLVRQVGGVWFINTGSVGRPDDGDPRACYAMLDVEPASLDVRHYRIEYDVGRAVAAIREHDLPEAFAQMALQGRNLDTVLDGIGENFKLHAVLRLAQSCDYEVEHTHQVERLALRLFDELRPLHNLGTQERFWLQCGAILHDIGWIEGKRRHHKTSLRIIMRSPDLPFNKRERRIIGLTARYHRKALPKKKHRHFKKLDSEDRDVVRTLAAILRVADGLDRTHEGLVERISCKISTREILLRCAVSQPATAERAMALEKGVLLEQVFGRPLAIDWNLV